MSLVPVVETLGTESVLSLVGGLFVVVLTIGSIIQFFRAAK